MGKDPSTGDQTWRTGWPPSADDFWRLLEEAVYASGHWTAITSLVKNKRAQAEYLAMGTIQEELKEVKAVCNELKDAMLCQEKYVKEARERKKALKTNAEVQDLDKEVPEDLAEEQEPEDPEEVAMAHMELAQEMPEVAGDEAC